MTIALPDIGVRPRVEPRLLRLRDNLIAVHFPLLKTAAARALVAARPNDGAGLIETTSGSMGIALASEAAAVGSPLTLVTPPLASALRVHLRALGQTRVVEVDGNQQVRLEQLAAEVAANPALHWTKQYTNPLVPAAYEPFGAMLAGLGVGAVTAAVGSGGSAIGIARGLHKQRPHARLIVVDAVNSVLFGRPDGSRLVPGIGNSLIPAHLEHQLVDVVHWMGDELMMAEARRLAAHEGLFVGPTGAAALKVARWHAARDSKVVHAAILPDEGHRYLGTVFGVDGGADALEPLVLGVTEAQLLAPEEDGRAWFAANWCGRKLTAAEAVPKI